MITTYDGSLPLELGPDNVVFLDIDGVLANTRHREHHVEQISKQWGKFFDAMPDDGLHNEGLALYKALEASGATIVYLTGRNEHYRTHTANWLFEHGFSLKWDLVMRPAGFSMPLARWKTEVLYLAVGQKSYSYIHPWWSAGFPLGGDPSNALATDSQVVIVDDDARVIQAAEDAGFTALQAGWQPKHPGLINTKTG